MFLKYEHITTEMIDVMKIFYTKKLMEEKLLELDNFLSLLEGSARNEEADEIYQARKIVGILSNNI